MVDQTPPTQRRLVLVLPDGSRVAIDRTLTVGRARDADVHIDHPTISRQHVRVSPNGSGAMAEDAGSRFGTLLGGAPLVGRTRLRSGDLLRLGDVAVRIDELHHVSGRASHQAAATVSPPADETVVVPVDATLLGLHPEPPPAPGEARGPRVRSGWALKRLGEGEGGASYVLRELHSDAFVRMEAADAALFELLDGSRTVPELLAAADDVAGVGGAARLTRLVAGLADRGLIDGVDRAVAPAARVSFWRRILRSRQRTVDGVGPFCTRAYHAWGRVLFHPLCVTALALLAVAGFAAFAYLVGARYGTPLVVARRLAIGGAVFLAGRFALVAMHELAHGLALAHYGRQAGRAGIRLILIFPYAFLETSEAYFEPRSRRMVITAAGPLSDLVLGATFALACAASPPGAVRDVFFQLAFGAYLGAFFNLNPFIERDGYSLLVDALRVPRLRARARQYLSGHLSGRSTGEGDGPVVRRYALAGLVWSAVGAACAVVFSNRYFVSLRHLLPQRLVAPVAILSASVLALPVVLQIVAPVIHRMRYGAKEVNRALP